MPRDELEPVLLRADFRCKAAQISPGVFVAALFSQRRCSRLPNRVYMSGDNFHR